MQWLVLLLGRKQVSMMRALPEYSLRHDVSDALASQLDLQLERAEAALCRRAFGLTASVALHAGIDEEGGGDWQQSLCFGKREGRFCLYLEDGFVTDTGDSPPRVQSDLFTASLETRLLAAKKLPVLARALELDEPGDAEQLAAAAAELGRFVDGLQGS
jgi:hypothetical protein